MIISDHTAFYSKKKIKANVFLMGYTHKRLSLNLNQCRILFSVKVFKNKWYKWSFNVTITILTPIKCYDGVITLIKS